MKEVVAMCINKASALFSDNTFSHNTATGNAGALRVDDCDAVTIERSKFSYNVAQGDGGGIYSYHFSTNYTITQSSFANNRAGGDGEVMYVDSTSSQVKIRKGTFNYITLQLIEEVSSPLTEALCGLMEPMSVIVTILHI